MADIIALVFDFDDTLAPDSTTHFLAQAGLKDIKKFWQKDVQDLLDKEWDPIPAYLYQMIQASQKNLTKTPITKKSFKKCGEDLPLHKGATTIFQRLRKTAQTVNKDVKLEFYLISSGIGDIIKNTVIAKEFDDIWASEFAYDEAGQINFPRKIISFTDKTRYIFQIQKGIVGKKFANKPFEVNKKLKPNQIRVPIKNMIFVGDGYTDIPCFSLVKKEGGVAIAVVDKNHSEKWDRAYQFIQDGRVSNLNSADYSENSDLSLFLQMAVKKMATDFLINKGSYQG